MRRADLSVLSNLIPNLGTFRIQIRASHLQSSHSFQTRAYRYKPALPSIGIHTYCIFIFLFCHHNK